MRSVMDVRKQLREICKAAKLISNVIAAADSKAPSETEADNILKAFLHGFKLNVARLCPDGSYKTFVGSHTVAIHPSSVLFGRKKMEAFVYNEYVYTTKPYARGVSAIQLRWLEEVFSID
jgi:ATP-dependent RNA helicase DHR2